MSSSKKRPHKSSSSSSKKQRAGADEEARLVDALSEEKPTRKEIESTEPGGAPTVIERTLPSFFDFYPRAKRAYDALKKKGPAAARLELLRACETVLTTGNADAMGKLVKAALAGEAGDAAAPIDVDADGADDDATFRWQADGGSAGWMDFDDASNAVAERARKAARPSADGEPVHSPLARLHGAGQHAHGHDAARAVKITAALSVGGEIDAAYASHQRRGARRRHGALKPRAPPQDECQVRPIQRRPPSAGGRHGRERHRHARPVQMLASGAARLGSRARRYPRHTGPGAEST